MGINGGKKSENSSGTHLKLSKITAQSKFEEGIRRFAVLAYRMCVFKIAHYTL